MMNKSILLLFGLGLLGFGLPPVAEAQNARSRVIIIQPVGPDVTGRSYYYNKWPRYQNNTRYYNPSPGTNIIINIGGETGDYDHYDNPYRYYRSGSGQNFYRSTFPGGEEPNRQNNFNY